MIYSLKVTSKFKRSFKQARKRNRDISLLYSVIEQLQHGVTLAPKHKDHALKGKYKGFRECHIQPDWLLIYLIENDILTLTLIDTGSYSDLFDE